MEEIAEEPAFICEDLDGLLRETDEGRARDLQEGSSQSVVRSPPRLGSERWRRLNGIHPIPPGPGRREQRATRSHPYIRRDSARCSGELQGPGEPGGSPESSSHSGDLPLFVRTSDPSPAYPASSPPQHSPHLHHRAIDAIPDRFPIPIRVALATSSSDLVPYEFASGPLPRA